jgi:hypothetical protein
MSVLLSETFCVSESIDICLRLPRPVSFTQIPEFGGGGYWEEEETGDVPSICPETTPNQRKQRRVFIIFVSNASLFKRISYLKYILHETMDSKVIPAIFC